MTLVRIVDALIREVYAMRREIRRPREVPTCYAPALGAMSELERASDDQLRRNERELADRLSLEG